MAKRILTQNQAARLRQVIAPYKRLVKFGKPWHRWTADELWTKVLIQLVVVGKAGPGDVLGNSSEAKKLVSLAHLKRLRTDGALQRHLHAVLLAVGTRYVSKHKSWKKDKKAAAAVYNFRTLEKEGPVKFFQTVANKRPESARIEYLRGELDYYGKKGARDTLIELGLARKCLALDARILGLLKQLGAKIDGNIDRSYEQVERELIRYVAKPSGLTGAKLDRILFRNYDILLADLKLKALN